MKKNFLLLLTAIISFNCHSQITFEKGYYIDNSNQKTNCLIKNIDWKNNPIDFEYKLSENAQTKNATIESIKEFGIYNRSKYSRNTVKIDRSSELINKMSHTKNPIFTEEQLFLKVLVEGKANLYSYEGPSIKRYFFNVDNSNIEQLVFKKFITSENKLGENFLYRQQLWKHLKCPTIKMNKIENLNYKKSSLINLFMAYNKCTNSDFIIHENKQKKDLFNLTFRPRLNNSSLTIENYTGNSRNTDFGNEIGFGFGIEAEYIIPFNKNKWAITMEPTYQNFKAKQTIVANYIIGGKLIAELDYRSIEIPISLRHYFFLNNNASIFINISYIMDLSSNNSSLVFKRADNSIFKSYEIETISNLGFGIGYKYNDKYSMEIRYLTEREILNSHADWGSEYKTLSIIFGYSIF